ncbi:MAG: putative quinol monooxygenase [Aggregatilineales bacterium]
MIVALVSIRVKAEHLEAFIAATLENARHSVQEAGVARFDFIQQEDDPTHFMLIEVFYSPEAQQAHRETAHYLAWREAVAEMLAEPRVGVRYLPLFPDQALWKYPDA